MSEMARIEGDEIVIRIPLAGLPRAASVAWDDAYGEHDITVVDLGAFAKEFVMEVNREEEDGTTLVDLMLDKAAVNAAENGAFGLSDPSP